MKEPSMILYNGEVHSIDNEKNTYEAVAISEGKVIALGTDNEILELKHEHTQFYNLEGKSVLPGFIDAHQHMIHLGFNLLYVDCRLNSIEEVVKAINEKAAEDEEAWVLGWGFDESLYKENRKLTKDDFADVTNPVFITRYCHHEAVVNDKALEIAGITKDTEIENGIIEKDEEGNPTGLLVEQAMSIVEKHLPPYTKENMSEALLLANQKFIENGITSIHEAGLGFLTEDPYKEFEVIQELTDNNEFQVRSYLMVMMNHFKEFIAKNKKYENEKIHLGSMKLFADGTLSGRTAAVLEPYRNSDNRGMLLYEDKDLKKYITLAHELDAQVAIHAIGDRAIEQVIKTYEEVNEENPKENLRHRIEHTTLSNENLLKRMQKLGAIPIPQPALLHLAGDVYVENVEDHHRGHLVDNRRFIDFGLKPAGSSDSPVIDCSPFMGIYAAMSRTTVREAVIGESVSLYEAIEMYTINAAHAAFEEDVKGSLELGKYADIVVLPKGFMEFTADQVKNTTVEMTIINGEVVYGH